MLRARLLLAYAASMLLMALWLPLMALLALVTFPFDRTRRCVGRFFRWYAVVVVYLCPVWRVRLEGVGRQPPRGPYVVVANHEGLLDIFLLSHLPWEMKWMAKDSLFRVPWVGQMMRLAGDICVDRSSRRSGVAALSAARRTLESGMPVMVFPEGTRSRTGELLPFKSGAFKLAIGAGCPVLPVAIQGTAAGMPVGSPWVRPAVCVARVLDPLPTTGLRPADAEALASQARERIQAALAEMGTPPGTASRTAPHTPTPGTPASAV
jgi:1-acyl-sn-glycerol-3-phosphate acyltransferase